MARCLATWPNLRGPGGCPCIRTQPHLIHSCIHGDGWSTAVDHVPTHTCSPDGKPTMIATLRTALTRWFGRTPAAPTTLGEVLDELDARREW